MAGVQAQGVFWISSDGDLERIIWGLKFTILGFWGARKLCQAFFWVVCKNDYQIWDSL